MARKLLSDYIKAYTGALSPSECEALIARFDAAIADHQPRFREKAYSFVELDVTLHWPEVSEKVQRILLSCFNQYQDELKVRPFWPSSFYFENLRLKRYMPDGRDGFAQHVDVMTSADAARFITAILYLNAPEGGETVFADLGVSVPPAPGKLVVFPPLWPFAHAGMPPRGCPKYILHTYLWYPPPG